MATCVAISSIASSIALPTFVYLTPDKDRDPRFAQGNARTSDTGGSTRCSRRNSRTAATGRSSKSLYRRGSREMTPFFPPRGGRPERVHALSTTVARGYGARAKGIPLPAPPICHRARQSSFASECPTPTLMLALTLIYSRRVREGGKHKWGGRERERGVGQGKKWQKLGLTRERERMKERASRHGDRKRRGEGRW